MFEVKYRGRVIGWLVEGDDGFIVYRKYAPVKAYNWRRDYNDLIRNVVQT